jgi:hypothetical protein
MPKFSSNLIRIVPKKNAVKKAPKLSIRKSRFWFEIILLNINRTFFGINGIYNGFTCQYT